MRGLYAILDVGSCASRGVHPLSFADAVLAVRPCAFQLRAKDMGARDMLALLRALGPLCRAAGVPLVCNDRADLAVLADCDMVHVGQDDAPIELVRRLSPGLRVGVSTHTLDQLARALDARPDYVAYGPVFPTRSKKNPDAVVGLAGLRAAAALVREHASKTGAPPPPLVAIGGISLDTAADVAQHADAGAVIGALLGGEAGAAGAREIHRRAAAFQSALGGGDARAGEPCSSEASA